jgi:hypothetical protein
MPGSDKSIDFLVTKDTTPQLSSRFCRLGQTGKCDGATVTDENDECGK